MLVLEVLRNDGAAAEIPELAWMPVVTLAGLAVVTAAVVLVRAMLLRRR